MARAKTAKPMNDALGSAVPLLAGQEPDQADRYIQWLGRAPTPHHAVVAVTDRLTEVGFQEWDYGARLPVVPGERRYVVHPDGKSVIAVVVGERSPVRAGYAMVGAHTDSPDLRLRLNPLSQSAGVTQLTTQFHGGLIRRAWLDRPLALAGAVYQAVRDKHGRPRLHELTGLPVMVKRLIHLDEPVGLIPDLAIHLDREKNDKGAINPQTMLNAIVASGDGDANAVLSQLAQRAGVDFAELDGFDLHFVSAQAPLRVGLDRSLVVGARHDDLAMVWCALEGLVASLQGRSNTVRTRVAAFFDAEETGSLTSSGAASSFLRDVLLRIARQHPDTDSRDDAEQAFAHSFCISADMAHAVHPNYLDMHDKNHAPRINQGPVLKANASDRYATTGETGAVFTALCEAADVRLQDYVVKQDMACGTTIGPITSAQLATRVVDVGLPMWAMHSAAETCGASDLADMVAVMRVFYAGRA